MKTTNFFTEMGKFAEHADLKFTITKKGDQMTVTMLPEMKAGGQRVRDFTATGTEHEMDEGFIPELTKGVEDAGGSRLGPRCASSRKHTSSLSRGTSKSAT